MISHDWHFPLTELELHPLQNIASSMPQIAALWFYLGSLSNLKKIQIHILQTQKVTYFESFFRIA